MRIKNILIVSLILIAPVKLYSKISDLELYANHDKSLEEQLYFEQQELVTGATKREVKLEEAPANITIVTHEDILQSGATNLGEVFRRVPGMDVTMVSTAETNVSARGFSNTVSDSSRMAVLLDGRTFYLEFLGGTIWSQFPVPLSDIKQIEVIKGPMSSLYGNRAMLGIINIITYEPEETKTKLSAGGGRYYYANGNFINAGKFADGYWYKVTGTYSRSNEFSNVPESSGTKDSENLSATGQFVFQPLDKTRLKLSGGITQNYGRYSVGLLTGVNDRRGYIDGNFNQGLGKYGNLYLKTYWDRNIIDSADNLGFNETIDNVDTEVGHTFSFNFNSNIKNTTTYGFNYRLVDGSSAAAKRINNIAGYFQDEVRFYDRVILTGGVRVDYQKDFTGTNTAAHGSLVFLAHPKYTVRGSIATAFNTPTYINLFLNLDPFPVTIPPFQSISYFGNRNLDSEKIIYVEMGNTFRPIDRMRIRADFFYYRLNNMITTLATAVSPTEANISYANDGGAEAIGGEISIEGDITKWLSGHAYWAYEHFDTINGNVDSINNLGNPKNKVGFGLRGKWFADKLTANMDFYYIQSHDHNDALVSDSTLPSGNVGDVYLLNARVGVWPIKNHLELAVMANNILNDNTPQIPTPSVSGATVAEIPQLTLWGAIRYIF